MKRFLVTGGLGFLGAPLVRRLVQDGHQVRVFDNGFRGSTNRLGDLAQEVEVISGDVRDAGRVDLAVRGIDVVCHFAFVNGTEYFYDRPAYVLDVGVKGMCNVVDACIRRGSQELILASSSEVYQTPPGIPTDESVPLAVPDPLNPRFSYGGGKIISELMAINYGRQYFKRVVILRPHNVFGPDMGWEHVIPQFVRRMIEIGRLRAKPIEFPIQGNGKQSRAFIFVDDFIEGVRILIDRGSHLNIYNIGTTEERTIADVAHGVAAALGTEVILISSPKPEGATERRCPSITKLAQLGFAAKWEFERALRVTVDWYRDHMDQYRRSPAESVSLFIPEMP